MAILREPVPAFGEETILFTGLPSRHSCRMAGTVEVPMPVIEPASKQVEARDSGYLVICWDDPINLMPYVTQVFQRVFGWTRAKAEKHMLEVHEQGRSVLVREGFEKAEFYVHELHKYSLQATLEPEDK